MVRNVRLNLQYRCHPRNTAHQDTVGRFLVVGNGA